MRETYDADVIVVGAGMLGGLAAQHLALAGKSVLILEAGQRVPRWRLLDAFRNSPNKTDLSDFYPDLPWSPKGSGGRYSDDYLQNVGPIVHKPGMLKLVGGTTWHWSSAFWRLIPDDFRIHTLYGVGRDWPLGYDDLEPWYSRVEAETGCSGDDRSDQRGLGGAPFPPRSTPYPLPMQPFSDFTTEVAARMRSIGRHFIDEPHLRATRPFDGRPVCCGNNNCSPICPIGAMYSGDMTIRKAELAGAQLVTDAVVFKLEVGTGGKIDAVHFMSPEGAVTRLTSRYIILAAHAIETPKLLLMSGVANRSDQVGRNLMGHTGLTYAVLTRDALWSGRGPMQQGGVLDRRGGPHRARHAAIKHGLNNHVGNPYVVDRLLKAGVMGSELDRQIRHDAGRYLNISTVFEMLPMPTNRVSLSAKRDALGLPKPQIYYDVNDYIRRGADVAREDFERFDAAFEVAEQLSDRFAWLESSHIMGTTIMGADPATSVVDAECRSHDHANLFIAGTSVFPSSSVVNPTLTGAALSWRLADRIARAL